MNIHSRRSIMKIFQLVVMASLLLVTNILATDGYFSVAYGTKSKGMAGAGVALADYSLFGTTNPAGMHHLGTKYGVIIGLFNPNRSYTVTGAATVPSPTMFPPPFGLAVGKIESDSKYFVMPALSANWTINNESSVGLSIFGNGGMNTDYDTKTFYAAYLDGPVNPDGSNPMAGVTGPTGVNLMQLFGSATYSRALSDNWSVGISAIAAWQSFEAEGLVAFRNFGMSQSPADLTDNGAETATGFGGKIGVLGEVVENFTVGATYQTKIAMSEFDGYKGLFAEEGDFDIPSSWTAGIAFKFSEDFTVAADVKQILYSGVKSVANPLETSALIPFVPNPNWDGIDPQTQFIPNTGYAPLGSAEGSGFGWEDMTVIKFGAEYAGVPGWKFRGGFSTGNNPVPESEVMFNILAPGIIENHLTVGVTKAFGDYELDFAIVRAFSNTVKGKNPLDPAQTIELEMDQLEFEVGFTF